MGSSNTRLSGFVLQSMVTFACASGFFLFGYDQGVFSGVIVSSYFLETFHNPNAGLLGTINAIFDIGGAVGAIICLFFGQTLGRKKTIAMGCIVAAIGAILQGTAKTVAHLIVGRIVGGIGVGQLTSTIGIYQAETSKAKSRGMVMCLELSLGATGLMLAQWTNYGFSKNNDAMAYQFPILLQLIFIAWTLLLLPFLPESPRWLVAQGKIEKAVDSLVRLGPKGTTSDSPEIRLSIHKMEEIARLENISGMLWVKSLFKGGPTQNGKRVLMSCLINIFQQLSGINSITYYVPTLLIKFIGVGRSDALWIAGLTSIISAIFSLVPVVAIDKIGRKPFLIVGAILQAMCFFVVAGVFAHIPPEDSPLARTYGITIVSFIYAFFAIFSSCWLGPSWMYGPEILPMKGRSNGMGLSVVCYWLFNFLIVEITPPALENISWKYYIILGIFNFCFAPILWLFFVETKGKSLEDLDIYFARLYHGNTGGDISGVDDLQYAIDAKSVGEAEHIEMEQPTRV